MNQTVNAKLTLADVLASAEPIAAQRTDVRRLTCRAAAPVLVASLLFAAWAWYAPLTGAVNAAGRVKPEFDRKTVQHLEGGVVRQVLVREGQAVRQGEALMVIADPRGDAQVALLQGQIALAQAQAARAAAEFRFADSFTENASGKSATGSAHVQERLLFKARRRTLYEQLAALKSQIEQTHYRAGALDSQIEHAAASASLAGEEAALNRRLADEGFVAHARVMAMQRQVADARSREAASRGEAAATRAQIAALRNAMAQARGQYQQRAADELKDARSRLEDLEERLRPALEQVERQTLRAPVDGVVMQLRVKAPGVAVGPREPLLEVAPSREALLVEARIDPHDIDHVQVGAGAQVRISAFDARSVRPMEGRVRSLAPDTVAQPDGKSTCYIALVEINETSKPGTLNPRLQPGMTAEVFIATAPRSFAAYLAAPLANFARRAMREP